MADRTWRAWRGALTWALVMGAMALGLATPALAQATRPGGVRGLPRAHAYQREIATWWATLKAADFEVENPKLEVKASTDRDELLRLWVLSLDVPRIGNKRSAPSTYMGADQFLLEFVESPADGAVIRPGVWAEPITWLANFEHPSNPYYKSRALKLRAFVVAAQDLMMVDEKQEDPAASEAMKRSDWVGPRICMWAYVFRGAKDVVPDGPRQAYAAGLKKMIERVAGWGPKGEETFFDVSGVTGMVIAAKAIDDPALTQTVEACAKRIFMPGRFYHDGGYFADQGCYDSGFNGLSLYFATWAAAESDWPWMKEAVARAWKLRGYLHLPEPDPKEHSVYGQVFTLLGPTHATLRTGSVPSDDQWPWHYKMATAAYLTEDAMCQVRWPNEEQLKAATQGAFSGMGHDLSESGKILLRKGAFGSRPWSWTLWPEHQNFPMQNYGYDCYPKGFVKRLDEVRAKRPEMLKLPFDRAGGFVERFADTWLIAKTPGNYAAAKPGSYGVVVHSGPVGAYPGNGLLEFPNAPYGLGGGTLSAFWTPATGSVILGRRGGMFAPGGVPTSHDDPAKWRNWPVHAVIGSADGETFFTSARIEKPKATYDMGTDRARVSVAGVIPAVPLHNGPVALQGRLDYARQFEFAPDGMRIETTVKAQGQEKLAELYEAIPVLHRDEMYQPKGVGTTIEFQVEGRWVTQFVPAAPPPPVRRVKGAAPATQAAPAAEPAPEAVEKVKAVRLTRFGGAVVVEFDRPRRVMLSPGESVRGFISGHVSRNVLVDLLEGKGVAGAGTEGWKIAYRIAPAPR